MEAIKIRLAQPKDMAVVIELCQEHAAYEKATYDKEGKVQDLSKHLFSSNPRIICMVIEQQENLVGYFTLTKQFSTWDADFYIYLDCLFLRAHARGQGFGKQIMDRIKEYAAAENCSMIQWQTPYFNHGAIGFYKRIGAEAKTKERFFWEI